MLALLTGFEGWAGRMNPSGKIAKSLNMRKFGKLEVAGYELPEDFYKLPRIVSNLVEKLKPNIIIGTGWDYISQIKVEKVSLNVQNALFGDSTVPDNYRHVPKGSEVIKRGDLALRSNLPSEKIVDRLHKKGIPAFVSYQAGTHCCNTVMYSAIFYSRKARRNTIAGFIHIPPVEEMNVRRAGTAPMDFEQETNAIEIALETSRDYYLDSR
jgi:pyroglutamyl-peptidase